MKYIDSLKTRTRALKKDIMAIYIACKRPETAWYIKLLAAVIIGYAMSPIDLIPDFIPVLGYLDDLLLLPLGLGLMLRLIPGEVMAECRLEAELKYGDKKVNAWASGFVILIIWAALIWMILMKIWA